MLRMIWSVIGNGKPPKPANLSVPNSRPSLGSRVSMSVVGSSGPWIERSRPHDRVRLTDSARSARRVNWWLRPAPRGAALEPRSGGRGRAGAGGQPQPVVGAGPLRPGGGPALRGAGTRGTY